MKYRFIFQNWWKWLTLLLLLYVFIAGFLVPLRPGVLDLSNYSIESGERFESIVTTYNTNWKEGDALEAFVRFDSTLVTQIEAAIIDGSHVTVSGILHNLGQKNVEVTLLLHSSRTGYLILPSAFLIAPQDQLSSSLQLNEGVESLPGIGKWKWAFPFRNILYETIRNTFFHVAIWMAMFVLLIVSLIYSIRYLRSKDLDDDAVASSFAHVAVIWGTMGMITGSIWAKATWGTYWTNDPKLNMSAVAMMIYLAYSILRMSIPDQDRRAQLSSAYNIFAFVAMIPLIFIIPRLTSSLHPGNGGNPALGGEDLDNTLRMIFYPAIIAYTLLGVWMSSLLYRMRSLELRRIHKSLN